MKRGLLLTLVTVAIALLCGNVFAYAPIIGPIPDVYIGDEEDNATVDINFFRFSDAFNFDDYVSKDAADPDQSTTDVRWSFLADNSNLITINGINTIADASESIQPDLVGKELTSYPNNDAIPRATSLATFYDLVDSPIGLGPPWASPTEASALDTIITIYCSNGSKASSKQIAVKAHVQDGVTELPDKLSGGKVHVITYTSPATEGWAKTLGLPDGSSLGEFYIATHVTQGGSVGASGSTTQNVWGSWSNPSTDIAYVPNNVYQVYYTIRSTQTDVAQVPNCRLMIDFIGTGILAASCANRVGKGLFPPDADGETYAVYAQPPDLSSASPAVTNVQVKFEVIDFDPNESGTNYLDQLEVYRFEAPAKSAGTLVASFTSQAEFGSAGWAGLTGIGTFGSCTVGSNTSGLYITTPATVAGGAGNIDYGAWMLGADSPARAFEAGRLYRCVYTLQSATPATLAKIRLYNASQTGDWNSQIALVSDQTQVHMPDADGNEYSNWYETMPQLYASPDEAKNQMSFNFDIADGQNAQQGTCTMTSVELYYYSIP